MSGAQSMDARTQTLPPTPHDGTRAPGGTWFGFPKGVYLLSFTELWERFSYWGMLALLVLFLTATLQSGGFGWEREQALKLYGAYTGLAFAAPLLGGWLANRYWGERRCILVGGILLVLGHTCLTGPGLVPWVGERMSGVDFHAVWPQAGVPLGQWTLDAAQAAALHEAGGVLAVPLYHAVSLSFLGGLALIIAGTALLKPTVSSVVGAFFAPGDKRRDGAFALFFVGLYMGAFSANIVVGFLGERVGWHWGFSAAGAGMALGLTAYLWKQRAWLAELGMAPGRRAGAAASAPLSTIEKQRIAVIVAQGVFTTCYAALFYQKGGLLTLFTRDHLDRNIGGWEVPVTWLLAVSTVTFLFATPLLARAWSRLARQGRDPSASTKLALGLLLLGVGYIAIIWAAASLHDAQVRASVWWIVFTYVCFGIGDALVWPHQISLTSKLAPASLSALFIGGWYITIGIGSWLTGYLGALGYRWGMAPAFTLFATMAIGAGVLLLLVTPRLRRWMHGAE